jgi:hypothetical protein
MYQASIVDLWFHVFTWLKEWIKIYIFQQVIEVNIQSLNSDNSAI